MKKRYLLITLMVFKATSAAALDGQNGGVGGTSKSRLNHSMFNIQAFQGVFETINPPEGYEIDGSTYHVVGVDLSTGRVVLQDVNGNKIERPLEGAPVTPAQ